MSKQRLLNWIVPLILAVCGLCVLAYVRAHKARDGEAARREKSPVPVFQDSSQAGVDPDTEALKRKYLTLNYSGDGEVRRQVRERLLALAKSSRDKAELLLFLKQADDKRYAKMMREHHAPERSTLSPKEQEDLLTRLSQARDSEEGREIWKRLRNERLSGALVGKLEALVRSCGNPENARLLVMLLNNFVEPESLEALIRVIRESSDQELRREAISRLELRDLEDQTLVQLDGMFGTEQDSETKAKLLGCLNSQRRQVALVEGTLQRSLYDEDPAVRRTALKSLDADNPTHMVILLDRMENDANGGVRSGAIESLSTSRSWRTPDVMERILYVIEHDSDEYVRLIGVSGIGFAASREDAKVVECLRRIRDSDKSKEVQIVAGRQLADWGEK